jgi:electron transport complex protein RnfE
MSKIFNTLKNSVWDNNPAIVQLLGLCPLLAVSNNLINALTLGLATLIVLTLGSFIISILKKYINKNLRIPYFMLIIASIVTLLILYLKAFSFEIYKILGVYLALITTNCVILGRVEAYAYRNTVLKSTFDGFCSGLGFTIILIILGSIRELLGQGSLCYNCHLLFGQLLPTITITKQYNFMLMLLPPGAFLCMGFLIALKNYLSTYEQTATSQHIRNISKITTAQS